ncbi:4'-phosphopantetheinyl transferase family protein [Streptomyces vinaceus]|uniref:4'-phosphopantetheinyl transferase family protein n=1 Tax=Streptomyces vinaceus TaxID=1960 RepID=UPI0037F35BF4
MRLLPEGVVIEQAFGDLADARLEPPERAVVAGAVAARQREFATARDCARRALARLGVAYEPLVPGASGAPSWPAGVVGSMTHCPGFRAAAVARAARFHVVALDAEPNDPVPGGVLRRVAGARERQWVERALATGDGVRWDRLLFSAKECVYKAWSPLTGRFLDFHEVELRPAGEGALAARLAVPGIELDGRPVDELHVRWVVRGGLLTTAVTVPRRPAPP